MSISAIYILDLFGKPLILRNYRGAHQPEIIDKFMISMLEMEEHSLTPVFQIDNITVAFIKHSNIYFVSTAHGNANITLLFVFLYKLVQVMKDYLKEVEEESVRDNFVVIHELLDEILDFGYPQTTESKILMEYITQESKKLDNQITIPPAVTNAVSWRSEGIRYKRNELFLDVIESVDLLGSANGGVIRSEIAGVIKIKANLSGMPELLLGLNDKLRYEKSGNENNRSIDLDEIKFHQCVRLCQFENNRNISFIPPDGEFELMSYRLNTYIKPPIWVDCITEYYFNSKVEYTVKVTSHFKSRFIATNVNILIPVPSDADTPMLKAAAGNITYVPEENVIKWTLKSFPGGKEFFMSARFGLPSVTSEEKEQRPPIQITFHISLFNISGIHVQYLKVMEKSGCLAVPWVRYNTKNGEYQIRHKEIIHSRNSELTTKKK